MPIEVQPASAFLTDANGRKILIDPKNPKCRATQRIPRFDLLKELKEPLAVDIEFQEFRPAGAEKWDHRMGRIAIVNTHGETIYDTYVRYEYEETLSVKMPPACFGVTWKDIRIANGAKPINEVRDDLNKIMADRTIIGHGMRLDVRSLTPELQSEVRFVDTQDMYGQVALSTLARRLGMNIQNGFHDPSEDAKATMGLYLLRHPYQNRDTFKPETFNYKDDAFPTLASGISGEKNKESGTKQEVAVRTSDLTISCDAVVSSPTVSSNATQDTSPTIEVEAVETKRSKGKKKAWVKFEY